jgi:SAM-dependent methyltransferase
MGLNNPSCNHYGSNVVPKELSIDEIINYAKWAKVGNEFVENHSRLPNSWSEFNDWYVDNKFSAPRILDVGCGTGYIAWCLAKEGAKVTGIDHKVNDYPEYKYKHENLSLLPLGLEDALCFDEENKVDIESTVFKSKNIKNPNLGEFDLVLNVWMAYGINLTPAIRAIDANCIYNVKSSVGGTGYSVGECGSCYNLDEIPKDAREHILSYKPSSKYEHYIQSHFHSENTSLFDAHAVVQFKKNTHLPYFELTKERAKERSELFKIKRTKDLNSSYRSIKIFTKDENPNLPFDVLVDGEHKEVYQLFDTTNTYLGGFNRFNSFNKSKLIESIYTVRDLFSLDKIKLNKQIGIIDFFNEHEEKYKKLFGR